MAVFLAEALYEVDQLREAEQLLTLSAPIVREFAMPDVLIIAHVILARIAFERGEVDHAYGHLSDLEYIGRQKHLARAQSAAQLERLRLALLRDEVTEAQGYLRRAIAPEAWAGSRGLILPANDVETVDLARCRLAARGIEKRATLNRLKADLLRSHSLQRNRRALKQQILLAAMLHAAGHARRAEATMKAALEQACVQGLIRTFVDEGQVVMSLVQQVRARHAEAVADGGKSDLVEFMDRMLHRFDATAVQTFTPRASTESSVTLSKQELCVLGLAAKGRTNNAIAQTLFVTESTVRAHLRNANVKLGTKSRMQAIAAVRQMGLMP